MEPQFYRVQLVLNKVVLLHCKKRSIKNFDSVFIKYSYARTTSVQRKLPIHI